METAKGFGLKNILLVIDEMGWAFHSHAEQIANRLSNAFQFKIVDKRANVPLLSKDFDICFIFDPIPLRYGYPPKEKTVMSLRCQFLYEEHPDGAYGLYNHGFNGRCVSIKDKCCQFIVLNNNQMSAFKDVVVDKPLIKMPHGVDERLFDQSIYHRTSSNNLRVGVVGRSSKNKGFDLVRCAVDSLENLELFHAGYHNKISKEKMPSFYSNIDVYVCMSKSEALNNGILEAGAMGLPVISTRSGAAEEIIKHGENGFLIERNVEDLAIALEKLRNGYMRREFGYNIKKEINENWTWKKRIEDFRIMFNNLLES